MIVFFPDHTHLLFVVVFVMLFLVSILVLQLRGSWFLYFVFLFLSWCLCYMPFPQGAVDWSVIVAFHGHAFLFFS